jgi:hypothetical protein
MASRDYKADLDLQIRALDIPPPEAEYRFAKPRRWKFDLCWRDEWIALEYEGMAGGGGGRSRHTSLVGYTNDCEKYSTAAILGWCVIRVTALMVEDGRAIRLIEQAFDTRRQA